ncbi:MAG: hypothetical protein ABIJ61_03760 [bacterium]
MLTRSLTLLALVILLSFSMALALNKPGDFILVNNDTGIQHLGSIEPFMTVADLPPSPPEWYPHPKDLKFDNQKFHWITQSPTQDLLGFASGTENQWIGFMNLKERWMKFVSWGIKTKFLDMTFSSSGKYMAYAFDSPDRRIKINIIEVPNRDQDSLVFMNTWFVTTKGGEQFRPLGWNEPADTVFSFEILDSLGQVMHHVDLNLHYSEALAPDFMKQARDRQPAGVVKPDDE